MQATLSHLIEAFKSCDKPWLRDRIRGCILQGFPHHGPDALSKITQTNPQPLSDPEEQIVFQYPQGDPAPLPNLKKKVEAVADDIKEHLEAAQSQGMFTALSRLDSKGLRSHFKQSSAAMKRFIREHGGKIHQNASIDVAEKILRELIENKLAEGEGS